jgi:hypothetical protein
VDDALARGLAADPADRPGAGAFAAAFAAALEGATAPGETVPMPAAPAAPPTRITDPTLARMPPPSSVGDRETLVASPSAPPEAGARSRRRGAVLAAVLAGGALAAVLAVTVVPFGDDAAGEGDAAGTTAVPAEPPVRLGPPEEVRVAGLLLGGRVSDPCFGEGVRAGGVSAKFTLREGEEARLRDFVQCGRTGVPEAATGGYAFAPLEAPAGTRVVAVEGFFGIEPNSRRDHPEAVVEWSVRYAGVEVCAPRVGPGETTDERIGGRACPVGAPVDAGDLEIAQRVSSVTPGVRLFAGVVAPSLIVRRPTG